MSPALLLRWLGLWLLLGLVLRLLMLGFYPADAAAVGAGGFAAGALNDLLAFMLLPGLAAGLGLLHPALLRPGYVLAVALMVLVFAAEVFFWLEFEGRPDRLIFHYLAYPKEVLVFLEDQFFLSLFLLPFVAVVWLCCRLIGWPGTAAGRGGQLPVAAVALLVALAVQPLQPRSWADSRVALAFVNNGYLSVLEAARYNEAEIPWLHAGPALAPVQQYPAGRTAEVRRALAVKKHVVLIMEESFAGPVWRDPELRRQYLPNFAALEKRSLSFTNLYATGSRTTRGMEAILNGFPPLPGISTTQRRHFARLPSLARAMEANGFYPVFLYGGWPGFSDFSEYWLGSGFRRVWSRDDFAGGFETSWGMADGVLFRRIAEEMDLLTAQQERVFLSTLTVSHHRPYDVPRDALSGTGGRRSSALAMAYADRSLGDFLRRAEQHAWFDDTVFVVVADHGPRVRGDTPIPAAGYRIPLLIYSSGLAPYRFEALGSSMSVPLTVVDMLGLETAERFSGASLLCDCPTPVLVEYGYHIGLLQPAADQPGARLHLITRQGDARSWHDDGGGFRPVPAAGRGQVLQAFAPAYRWYYSLEEG